MLSGLIRLFSRPEPAVCDDFFDEIEAILERYITFEKSIENHPDKVKKQIAHLEKTYHRLKSFDHKHNLQALGLNEKLLDALPSHYLDDLTFELLDIVILISGPNSTTPYTIGLSSLIGLIATAKTYQRDIEHPHRGPINLISVEREKTLEINEFSRQLFRYHSQERPLTVESLSASIKSFTRIAWREMLEFKLQKKRNQEQLLELTQRREQLVKRIENTNEEYTPLIEELDNIDHQINRLKPSEKSTAELKKTLNELMIEQENKPHDEELAKRIKKLLITIENRSGLVLLLSDNPEPKRKKATSYSSAP